MYFSPKTSADGLVFHYDTGNTIRSYLGEPTTNLAGTDAARTIEMHAPGVYGNAGIITDAPEKGPGWKKITITNRGNNFRIAQFPYTSLTGGVTYTYSLEVDMGTTSGYFWRIDGTGGYSAITIVDSRVVTTITPSTGNYAIFLNHNTTGVSGISEVIYYRYYQVEQNSHATQFTTGTRSATQGLKDLTAGRIIDITNVTFDSNAQITFDGTNDYGQSDVFVPGTTSKSYEAVTRLYNVNHQAGGVIGMMGENGEPFDTIVYNETDQGWGFGSTGFQRTAWSGVKETTTGFVHLVATYLDYNYKLYRNGQLILTTTSFPILNYNFNSVIIFGKRHGATTGPYLGEIPMTKVYNRALTADEVARNFNAIKSRFNIG